MENCFKNVSIFLLFANICFLIFSGCASPPRPIPPIQVDSVLSEETEKQLVESELRIMIWNETSKKVSVSIEKYMKNGNAVENQKVNFTLKPQGFAEQPVKKYGIYRYKAVIIMPGIRGEIKEDFYLVPDFTSNYRGVTAGKHIILRKNFFKKWQNVITSAPQKYAPKTK